MNLRLNRDSKHPIEAVRHARQVKRENPGYGPQRIAKLTAEAYSLKRLSKWTVSDWIYGRTRVPFA